MFMETNFVKLIGFTSMINMHSWMFLASFQKLRDDIILNKEIVTMLHLGARAFDTIPGEVVQTVAHIFRNANIGLQGVYFRLVNSTDKQEDFFDHLNNQRLYATMDKYLEVPKHAFAYWATEKDLQDFSYPKLKERGEISQGLITGSVDLFLKYWFEVNMEKINFHAGDAVDAENSGKKWFPYNKGGEYRKWRGNDDYVVNWENNGFAIKHFVDEKGKLRSRPQGTKHYFEDVITWTKISTSTLSFRHKPTGYISSEAGMTISVQESEKKYILGLCNSKVASHFLEFLSPTMNYELGDIEEIPVCVTLHVVITMVHLVIVSITIIRVTVPSMKQLPIQERL